MKSILQQTQYTKIRIVNKNSYLKSPIDILSPTCRVQDSGCLCGPSRGSLFTHVSIANITSASIPLKLVQIHSTTYQLVFTSSSTDATVDDEPWPLL
jgi:hypothetical protein